jgi:hypothetical protein
MAKLLKIKDANTATRNTVSYINKQVKVFLEKNVINLIANINTTIKILWILKNRSLYVLAKELTINLVCIQRVS